MSPIKHALPLLQPWTTPEELVQVSSSKSSGPDSDPSLLPTSTTAQLQAPSITMASSPVSTVTHPTLPHQALISLLHHREVNLLKWELVQTTHCSTPPGGPHSIQGKSQKHCSDPLSLCDLASSQSDLLYPRDPQATLAFLQFH